METRLIDRKRVKSAHSREIAHPREIAHLLRASIVKHAIQMAVLLAVIMLVSCTTQQPEIGYPPTSAIEGDSTPAAQPTATIPANQIRSPGFAGKFYPDNPRVLAEMVDDFLAAVDPVAGEPIALLMPHAGYVYSGQVAAYSFRQLIDSDIDVAVIIGNDHYPPLASPIAVWTTGAWQTPLGPVVVDEELASALVTADARINDDQRPFAGEHPIEVALPFLQRSCPRCHIVPVLIGGNDPEDIHALAEALSQILLGRKAVIIASSDLSHYPPYGEAKTVDGLTLDAIASFDPDTVRAALVEQESSDVPNLYTCACSAGAILTTMEVARSLGADTATVLHYANSGDVPQGRRGQVVGYGAVMFWRAEPGHLNERQHALLLTLARDSISAKLKGEEISIPTVGDPDLLKPHGVFVTLKIDGELRGCIGNFAADRPLQETVQQMALAAAFEDPRFPPLSTDELSRATIDISILSPTYPIGSIEEIEIGQHGLLIAKGRKRGVFLPHVPVEQGWDLQQYLENLCQKAELPVGCWDKAGAKLYGFTAEVFGDPR